MSFIINPYRFATGANDPYWSSVIFLAHCDAYPVVDSSSSPITITDGGLSSVINTTAPKFGAGNADFYANNRFFNAASDSRFTMGTNDWTWEAWIKGPTRTSTSRFIFGSNFMRIRCNNDGLSLLPQFSFNGSTYINFLQSVTILNNAWSFVSISRKVSGSNSIFKVFSDGVQISSDQTLTSTNQAGSGGLNFGGAAGNTNTSYGAIDDCRITKGVARYTANFTPPTAAFPDS
jgi:hypothetical protein